jgi:hypothetical protein
MNNNDSKEIEKFYRAEIIKMVESIDYPTVLRYIYIIVSDIKEELARKRGVEDGE